MNLALRTNKKLPAPQWYTPRVCECHPLPCCRPSHIIIQRSGTHDGGRPAPGSRSPCHGCRVMPPRRPRAREYARGDEPPISAGGGRSGRDGDRVSAVQARHRDQGCVDRRERVNESARSAAALPSVYPQGVASSRVSRRATTASSSSPADLAGGARTGCGLASFTTRNRGAGARCARMLPMGCSRHGRGSTKQ